MSAGRDAGTAHASPLDVAAAPLRAPLHVCLIAAENDALPDAKVGGIADVLRDVPAALSRAGVRVTVVLPSYGHLHRRPEVTVLGTLSVRFAQGHRRIEAFTLPDPTAPDVRLVILHDAEFAPCGEGRIYCDDPADAPFATDASKYALFGAAAAELLGSELLVRQDVLHLHDWHSAFVAILRAFDPQHARLRDARLIFTIHNLALQGIRPFEGHVSSLQRWYPWLSAERQALVDPRWHDCVNPMAAAIRLADRVHAVSPTYALEIVEPDDPARGFRGGEGLQADLATAAAQGRLVGILNGTAYPGTDAPDQAIATRVPGDAGTRWRRWMRQLADDLLATLGGDGQLRAVDYIAHQRVLDWSASSRPMHVLTSVGRLVDQKASLLFEPLDDGRAMLDHLLERHAEHAVLLLVGSGDPAMEAAMHATAARQPNLLFINRHADGIADSLFRNGDLFLMPSSFEPCGISQMLAMRAGQPCLVHAVGGLVDTVEDGIDGFHFSGTSRPAQARAMIAALGDALRQRGDDAGWRQIVNRAAARRFDWQTSARRYLTELYRS